jgi:endoglucanase
MSKAVLPFAFITLAIMALAIFKTACCQAAEDPNAAKDQAKAVEMNKLLGRGVNLGNALEAPHEGEWGVTLKEEYFQIIKDAGFNSVRLPVRWSAHAPMEAPYTIDPNFFKRVDWAINCALSRNLPVILNMHHYRELYTDPLPHKERFMALWKQIAEHYNDYPDTLLLEILNEPDDALTPEMWNEWLKEAHSIIRKSNPTKTIVVDSANDAWISYLKFLKLPEDDRNIIVSVHHYFPLEFTHQGASWITDGDPNTWMGTKWTGTDSEKKAMTDIFDVGAAWAKEHNRPINLGEFGSYRRADMDSRVRWTKFIADTAAQRGMSLHYWEFCASEFGLYDQKTKSWHKELLEAVILPKQ